MSTAVKASLIAFALVSTLLSCTQDPVQSDGISALGKEKGAANEFHRAGQPCGICHQAGGTASSDFSVSGTVFASSESLIGVEGARIDLVDANKTSPPASAPLLTNCVGNFFILRSDWDPAYPIAVRVTKGGISRGMQSAINRASSCADCHKAEVPLADPFSTVKPVFLFGAEGDPVGKAKTCDRDPDLGAQ
ncbi:MAG: hypothetical protein ABIP89_07810 [Polyangiaceae bacterium]